MDDDALRQWLALSLLPGLTPTGLNTLWQHAGSGKGWLQLDAAALSSHGLSRKQCAQVGAILQGRLPAALAREAERALAWAAQPGNYLLPLYDAAYPALLREIPDPPPLLYVRGHPAVLDLPQLALVGSRKPSADGRRAARAIAAELCTAGYHITSGLALGIDTASHQGALDRNGVTVAVLGSGLRQLYPMQNRALAEAIVERGALVSEFPLDTPPLPACFPQRNRVISGLAHGVLVVEAALRSGSLITARLAAEQGREVFAIPGSIHNPVAAGCHQLLRQGATLVAGVDDLFEELPGLLGWERQRLAGIARAAGGVVENIVENTENTDAEGEVVRALAPEARRILDEIAWQPLSIDVLALHTRLPVPQLYTHLTTLELAGLILREGGGYVRGPGKLC